MKKAPCPIKKRHKSWNGGICNGNRHMRASETLRNIDVKFVYIKANSEQHTRLHSCIVRRITQLRSPFP